MVIVVDNFLKLSSYDVSEEHKEEVRIHLVAIEEAMEIPAKNSSHVERFNKDGRYPKHEQHLPRECDGRIALYPNATKNGSM